MTEFLVFTKSALLCYHRILQLFYHIIRREEDNLDKIPGQPREKWKHEDFNRMPSAMDTPSRKENNTWKLIRRGRELVERTI